MKKIVYSLIILLFLVTISISTASKVHASEDKLTIYVLTKKNVQDNVFKKMIENYTRTDVVYEVPEIGLYQVTGSQEELKKLVSHNNIVKNHTLNTTKNSHKTLVNAQTTNNQNINIPKWQDLQWDISRLTSNGENFITKSNNNNTTVAIIDSGVNNHPDLKEALNISKNLVPKGGNNGQEELETGDISFHSDFLGHGTMLAGQMASNGFSKGLYPGLKINSYRVFGSESAESIWVIKGIIEAAKDDSDVINLSLIEYISRGDNINEHGQIDSTDKIKYEAYERAINYAKSNGSILVTSIGNQSLNLKDKTQIYKYWKDINPSLSTNRKIYAVPASFKDVVSVGSINHENIISNFSNYNSADIYTYGGDNRLVDSIGSEEYISNRMFEKEWILALSPQGGYTYSFGTSLSAAKVSAIAAAIIEKNNYKDKPDLTERALYNMTNGNKDKLLLELQ
ncbi:S8 family peptidase [Mammaliicoccus vitulinus]|uniref:S8 family peptidase n=1 Tax=Mammaliicoccus vitulinus TaxID=71237 RepID=UPI000D1D4F3B|nr:S8 family serine peptidase [Mammaliicoccus vitulinus]PTI89132.1 enterotoxin [Mammaliicoccus vitulinus]